MLTISPTPLDPQHFPTHCKLTGGLSGAEKTDTPRTGLHTRGWPSGTSRRPQRQPCSAPPGRRDTSGACPVDSSAAWEQGSASRGLRSGLGGAASPCFPQRGSGSGTCVFLPAVKHDAFSQTGRLESKSPLCFICDPAPTTHPQFWSWNYVRRLKFKKKEGGGGEVYEEGVAVRGGCR